MGLIFRSKNNTIIPIQTSGISKGIQSSSIGAPARLGGSEAVPNDRLFQFAYDAKEKAETKLRERKPIKEVQNFTAVKFEAESNKKTKLQQLEEKTDAYKERLDKIRGKTADVKEKRDDIRDALKNLNFEKTALSGYNINSVDDALRLNNLIGGDPKIQKQLEQIQNLKIKNLKKQSDKEALRLGKLYEQQTKQNAEVIDETARELGLKYDPSTDSYVPDENTVQVAEQNLNVTMSPAQKQQLLQTQIQAPPKLDSTEIMILMQSEGGQERLRNWGYFK